MKTRILRHVWHVAATALIFSGFLHGDDSFDDLLQIAPQQNISSSSLELESTENPPQITPVRNKKPWTLLAYIAANNNLHTFALQNIRQMARIGSNDNINIVVQFDGIGERSIKRYLIEQGQTKLLSTFKPEVETMSGTPQSLYQFIKWGCQAFPSTYLGLDLWNHGSGIKDPGIWGKFLMLHRDSLFSLNTETGLLELTRRITSNHNDFDPDFEFNHDTRSFLTNLVSKLMKQRGIAFNDADEVYIDNQQLKAVLDNVCRYVLVNKKIDVVFMDACHMGMVEIATKMRPYVDYMVGSSEVEPGTGYDYSLLLAPFTSGALSPRAFAMHGVTSYERQYKGSYADYTQAAVELKSFTSVETVFTSLAKTLYEALSLKDSKVIFDTIKTVRLSSKHSTEFYDPDYIDAGTFFTSMASKFRDVKASNNSLNDEQLLAIENIVRLSDAGLHALSISILAETHGSGIPTSQGLGMFFPKGNIHPSYLKTTFDKTTGWSVFLGRFLNRLKYGRMIGEATTGNA
jgi:hypothetical protein